MVDLVRAKNNQRPIFAIRKIKMTRSVGDVFIGLGYKVNEYGCLQNYTGILYGVVPLWNKYSDPNEVDWMMGSVVEKK